ncbi:isochorismate synthase [Nonomuraea salmonea]|uniref:isochorismate synthase n=1 Tax=Nonomuraea salmonea TaxID=46181 RepID=UPI002FE96204
MTRHEPLTVRPCLRCASAVWRVAAKPSAEDHIATVRLIRDRIAAGEANRIVLAQTLTATGSHGLDVTDLLIHLSGRAPYTFALPLGHGRTLVGTSAELLIARHGRALTTHPLAGAAPRHPTSFADQKAARDLLNSRKKRYEHRLVVESAAATLAPFCRDLRVPKQPQLQATATMWHLGSRITATLTDPPPTSLGLAAELHPPPTSCGTPTQAARTLITELEHGNGVRRGWYAGLVGWQNAAGDGEWALTLCCAVTESPRRLRLWAGAGITAASEPADVLLETSTQLATMLQALHAIPRLH